MPLRHKATVSQSLLHSELLSSDGETVLWGQGLVRGFCFPLKTGLNHFQVGSRELLSGATPLLLTIVDEKKAKKEEEEKKEGG